LLAAGIPAFIALGGGALAMKIIGRRQPGRVISK